jgi:hypothetical protein
MKISTSDFSMALGTLDERAERWNDFWEWVIAFELEVLVILLPYLILALRG